MSQEGLPRIRWSLLPQTSAGTVSPESGTQPRPSPTRAVPHCWISRGGSTLASRYYPASEQRRSVGAAPLASERHGALQARALRRAQLALERAQRRTLTILRIHSLFLPFTRHTCLVMSIRHTQYVFRHVFVRQRALVQGIRTCLPPPVCFFCT